MADESLEVEVTDSNEFDLTVNPPYIGSAYSPTVDITETAQTITVTITDEDGAHSYSVPNTEGAIADAQTAATAANNAAIAANSAADVADAATTRANNAAGSAADAASAANGAATLANAKADAANEAAQAANSAASLASTKAGAANTAAENANAAAILANAKAAEAESAAGYAATATTNASNAADAAGSAAQSANDAAAAASAATATVDAAVGAANSAASYANQKGAAAAQAASDASAAATLANSKATAANNAAELANAKAELADTKAGLADTAATAANTAAAAANTAAAYANGFTEAYMPDATVGATDSIKGGTPSDQEYMRRAYTGHDGVATIECVKGNTVVWNQLVQTTDSTITPTSGHKYFTRISGTASVITSDGTAISVTGATDNIIDLTRMFGAGNEPATVAEFEALYPNSYYAYDAGTLKPVKMLGVETVGFNQWDEEWEQGSINGNTGQNSAATSCIRSKNYIPAFPSTNYCISQLSLICFYDLDKNFISYTTNSSITASFATPSNCRYIRFRTDTSYGVTYKNDICLNLSNPTRNGTYQPYTHDQREIPVSTFFPTGIKRVGDKCDALYNDHYDTVIGSRAYAAGDESDSSVLTDGTTTYYALSTPTTTAIDPPLNMSYRVESGGTESIMLDTTQAAPQSAPPILSTAYGYTAESLIAAAQSVIAPVENYKASGNYAVGSYLMHQGKLYRVTSAIASGESITPGTNVTQTTVMAELVRLTA